MAESESTPDPARAVAEGGRSDKSHKPFLLELKRRWHRVYSLRPAISGLCKPGLETGEKTCLER